jgi:hypothetical protein
LWEKKGGITPRTLRNAVVGEEGRHHAEDAEERSCGRRREASRAGRRGTQFEGEEGRHHAEDAEERSCGEGREASRAGRNGNGLGRNSVLLSRYVISPPHMHLDGMPLKERK